MKALQLSEIGKMQVVDLPDPTPGPGDVVIRIVATGICGSDIHGFTGENGRRVPGQVMGHESAGVIEALGNDVHGLQVGAPVTFNPVIVPEEDLAEFEGREQMCPRKTVIGVAPTFTSSFAQQIVVPVRNVIPLPEGMPLALGALVEPLAVATHAVRRAGVTPEDAVLVTGGGPIGQSVVLALQMAGVTNIAVTEMSAIRRELVQTLGAVALPADDPDVASHVHEALGGPADVAIDAVGVEATLHLALTSTHAGSTVCLVGMGLPDVSLKAFEISTQERSLVGSFVYTAQDFRDAAARIGDEPDKAQRLISREVPLAEGPTAFSELAYGENPAGKVLVRLDVEADA